MKKLLPILILLLCSAAWAQTETKPVVSGKAIVYFYSLAATTTIGRVKKPVFVDDIEIADIRPEKYFIVLLDPGKHTFRMRNKKLGGIEMDFEADKTYYIRVNWATGNIVKPVGISKVEPEAGAYDIKQLVPVDKNNIKAKSVVFTELPN